MARGVSLGSVVEKAPKVCLEAAQVSTLHAAQLEHCLEIVGHAKQRDESLDDTGIAIRPDIRE